MYSQFNKLFLFLNSTIFHVFIVCVFILTVSVFPVSYSDWKRVEVVDTLMLIVNNRESGVVIHGLSVDSSTGTVELYSLLSADNWMDLGGGDSVKMSERKVYAFDGRFLSAVDTMKSMAGESIWKMSLKNNKWEMISMIGGVKNSMDISEIHSDILNIYHNPQNRIYTRLVFQ